MPYDSIDKLPPQTNKLPDHAKKIFMASFNASYPKDGEEAAFKIAWSAVSRAGYVKKDDEWKLVSKSSLDYWRNRFTRTDQTINRLMSDEERKAILRSARAHAGGKAKAAKMKERKMMESNMGESMIMKDVGQLLVDISDYIEVEDDEDISKADVDAPAPGAIGALTTGDVHVNKPIAEEKRIQRKYKKPVEKPPPDTVSYMKSKSFTVPIIKRDEEKRIVYGVVLEPYTIDAQGDWETPESIEKAAHDFMSMYREMGIEHVTKNESIYPVESYIAPTDITIEYDDGSETVIKAGSWVLGSYVGDDSAWDMVKKGELTGYSVEGLGKREECDPWYEDIMKRDISDKERQNHPESDFAGEGRSFPIFSQADVSAAFHSLGRAGSGNYSTDQIRQNIIRIARHKGFSLPKSAEDG